jgi:hypothetical protein
MAKNYDITNVNIKILTEKKKKLEAELKELQIEKQLIELNDAVRWLQDRVNNERKSLQKG